MEKHWLKNSGSERLLIVALGWSAGFGVVEGALPGGCDVLCLCDYREMEPLSVEDRVAINSYRRRYLFAWSFGVWAAEQLLQGVEFDRAVALNGTPFPVDARYGIEPRRMAVTIKGLGSGGMDAFNRRAYGDHYARLADKLSPRSLDDNIRELELLVAASQVPYKPSIAWDKAIVGSGDMIFPTENMLYYWGECAQLLPLPHYPFGDRELIRKEIGDR